MSVPPPQELQAEQPPESVERRKTYSWFQGPRRLVLAYTVAFVVSEFCGALISIELQAILDALLILAAVNQAAFGFRTQRTAGLVMAALFSTRLTVLTLPPLEVSLPTLVGITGVIFTLVAYIATWVIEQDISSGRSQEGFPLKPPLVSKRFTAFITTLSSLPIAWLGHQLLDPKPFLINPMLSSTTLPLVIAGACLAVGALGEELLYRRLVAAMVQHTGHSQTPVISGVLFAASYMGTRNLTFVVFMFVAGAFFAWSCERTGSLKPVVAAHAIASILIFLIL